MAAQEMRVNKNEMLEIVEILGVLSQFSTFERIAIRFYLKGRLDAERGNIEIPMELVRSDGQVERK